MAGGMGAGGRVAVALLALGLGSGPAWGQTGPFSFQLRGGGGLAVGAFRDGSVGWEGEAGGGPALAMGFTFPLPGPGDLVLGFSQLRFACDRSLCPAGRPWVSTGFDVALRSVWWWGQGAWGGWVQGGLHTHRMEGRIRGPGGGTRVTSGGGGGFEVGVGLLWRWYPRLYVGPGVRYGEGNVPFPSLGRMHPRYLVLDLGVSAGF